MTPLDGVEGHYRKRWFLNEQVPPLVTLHSPPAPPAPAQDVGRRILGEDVTQTDYYTERVKQMVGKVLTGNGITRYERGTYDLVGGEEVLGGDGLLSGVNT